MTERPTGDATLREARRWVREGAHERSGVRCPCCTQNVKIYERQVHSGMARSLIGMYRAGGLDWVYLPEVAKSRSRDEAMLRYWGLIEEADATRKDGGHAGWWRVTVKGEQFILGKIKIERYALVFNKRVLAMDDSEWVTIHDALGTKFDLRVLMGWDIQDEGIEEDSDGTDHPE